MDRAPDKFEFYTEIFVDQFVPHGSDISPRDFRIGTFHIFREVLHGLTYDLEIADNRILRLPVSNKDGFPSRA